MWCFFCLATYHPNFCDITSYVHHSCVDMHNASRMMSLEANQNSDKYIPHFASIIFMRFRVRTMPGRLCLYLLFFYYTLEILIGSLLSSTAFSGGYIARALQLLLYYLPFQTRRPTEGTTLRIQGALVSRDVYQVSLMVR